jgi:hypothetical protein
MENPLTGRLEPRNYEVEVYRDGHIVTVIEVRTTNEEEAVAQAVKHLTTKVKRK